MCGEAQNITMDKSIIDSLFTDTSIKKVHGVIFTGGEPLLAIDIMLYAIEKINQSNWETDYLEFTTNGTVFDERIVEALEIFCERADKNSALIRISNDIYHNENEYYGTYSKFRNAIDNNRCKKIELKYTREDDRNLDSIRYSGKAIALVDGESEFLHGKNVKYISQLNHRIRVEGNAVKCGIQILANGGICTYEDESFNNQDIRSIGVVGSNSLAKIIEAHNQSCLLLCPELNLIEIYNQCHKFTSMDKTTILYCKTANVVLKRVLNLRQYARRTFTAVHAQDIILELQFPTVKAMSKLISSTYNFLVRDSIPQGEVRKQSVLEIFNTVKDYWSNDSGRRYPYQIFGGHSDIMKSRAFQNLQKLNIGAICNGAISGHKLCMLEDKVFACGELEALPNIDYANDMTEWTISK